ncbi:MAG: c-type cytochrome [Anaerolineales bacterium]
MTIIQKTIGVLATLIIVIALPLYTNWEDSQQEHLQEKFFTDAVLSATDYYAENCAVCHGAAGEGIGDNPTLNSEAVRSMSESDLYKVISRGREGTLMAGWASEEGGVFSNFQIYDFVTFIQQVNWAYVESRVEDLGLTPPEVIKMEVSQEMLASLSNLPNGEVLGEGLTVYAENCSACHGANGSGTVIAPAINSIELRSRSLEEVTSVVREGVSGSLMASWEGKLTSNEISSVVDLVFAWPEIVQAGIVFPETEPADIPSSPEAIAAGAQLFSIACTSCHGLDGYGTNMAPALNNEIFLTEFPDAAIYQVIAGGVPDTLMPAWGSRLEDREIQSLVNYLRSWQDTAPAILPPVLEN